MNYLQYTSKEMYSSTELIRKSKSIFDKLNKKEIEKAIILRDGKPSFMLLDFETYEEIMIEYTKLKNNQNPIEKKQSTQPKQVEAIAEVQADESTTTREQINENKISEEDMQKALADIDNLDFSFSKEEVEKKDKPPLKEFWE